MELLRKLFRRQPSADDGVVRLSWTLYGRDREIVVNVPKPDELNPDQTEQCYLQPMVAAAVGSMTADLRGQANHDKIGRDLERWLEHTSSEWR